MLNINKMMRPLVYTLLFLLVCSLYGCNTTHALYNASAEWTAADYLQLADNASPPKKTDYLLAACAKYIQNRQAYNAQLIIDHLPFTDLSMQQQVQYQLLQAHIMVLNNRFSAAANQLNGLTTHNVVLTTQQQKSLYELLAQVYQQQNNIIGSIQQQTLLMNLETNTPAYNQTLRNIWISLQTIPSSKINTLLTQNNSPYIEAWLRLAAIINGSITHSNHLIQQLANWQASNPSHPANTLLPANLQQQSDQAQPPRNIALLLPLTGSLAAQGNAIRNGVFAAYYYWKKSVASAPTITVYDTNDVQISDIYQQAVQQGADFVIGPLTKAKLSELIHTHLSVPTLALNTIPSLDAKDISNLYQFGLSPLDEAIQVAQKAMQDQHHRVIIISPDNPWGQAIADTFKNAWQQQDGQVVAQLHYKNQASLSHELRHLLGLDQSNIRADVVKRMAGGKFHFIPRRRKDFDSIFLVATASAARQIKPRLNYYYAGDAPVYSISQIYSGLPNEKRDRDLNGILFCDIPWVLEKKQTPGYLNTIKTTIQHTWPQSFGHHPKLYALGVDAYSLAYRLNKIALLPNFGVTSATGVVYLAADHHLYRRLPWAQFKHGKPSLTQ